MVDENVPAGHEVHWELPETSLYVPAGQAVQPDPSYPGLHRQALEEMLPAGDVECAGHEVHVPPFMYCPAGHEAGAML